MNIRRNTSNYVNCTVLSIHNVIVRFVSCTQSADVATYVLLYTGTKPVVLHCNRRY